MEADGLGPPLCLAFCSTSAGRLPGVPHGGADRFGPEMGALVAPEGAAGPQQAFFLKKKKKKVI